MGEDQVDRALTRERSIFDDELYPYPNGKLIDIAEDLVSTFKAWKSGEDVEGDDMRELIANARARLKEVPRQLHEMEDASISARRAIASGAAKIKISLDKMERELPADLRGAAGGLGLPGVWCKKRGQLSKRQCAPGSYRWTRSGKARVLICCPRGKWDAKRGRCRVGTRAHEVLVPPKGKSCPTGYRRA